MKKRDDYKKTIEGLHSAWEVLRKHPKKTTTGVDKESINSFSSDYSYKISVLSKDLSEESFRFTPLKRSVVEKGREILVPTVRERIVTTSLLKAIFPKLEDLNSNLDFSRRGLYIDPEEQPDFEGTPLAVKKIQEAIDDGYVWVLEADIQKFFDFVPKDKIFKLINQRIRNKKIIALIKQIIYFDVAPSRYSTKTYSKTHGIAQGSTLSPLLASIYLYKFDNYISRMKDVRLVRYVDDFIILCKTEKRATEVYELARKKLDSLGLHMYEIGEKNEKGKEKTRIILAKGYGAVCFDFLGFTFNCTDVDICQKKKEEITETIKVIIHSGKPNLLQKIKSLDSRIIGYIEHYRKEHYTRTVPSLLKIIRDTEDELKSYYVQSYRKITSKHPFAKLQPPTVDRLFALMGIDFTHLETKTLEPPPKKKHPGKTA